MESEHAVVAFVIAQIREVEVVSAVFIEHILDILLCMQLRFLVVLNFDDTANSVHPDVLQIFETAGQIHLGLRRFLIIILIKDWLLASPFATRSQKVVAHDF